MLHTVQIKCNIRRVDYNKLLRLRRISIIQRESSSFVNMLNVLCGELWCQPHSHLFLDNNINLDARMPMHRFFRWFDGMRVCLCVCAVNRRLMFWYCLVIVLCYPNCHGKRMNEIIDETIRIHVCQCTFSS